MMWRKIDSHPRDETVDFLVWGPNFEFPMAVAWDEFSDEFYLPIGGYSLELKPTHWMPLPEPPHDTH
jgi:hypothetical protein